MTSMIFLVPCGHGAATFHQTYAQKWNITPLPIQSHVSYSFLTPLLPGLSVFFSTLNYRVPSSLLPVKQGIKRLGKKK